MQMHKLEMKFNINSNINHNYFIIAMFNKSIIRKYKMIIVFFFFVNVKPLLDLFK